MEKNRDMLLKTERESMSTFPDEIIPMTSTSTESIFDIPTDHHQFSDYKWWSGGFTDLLTVTHQDFGFEPLPDYFSAPVAPPPPPPPPPQTVPSPASTVPECSEVLNNPATPNNSSSISSFSNEIADQGQSNIDNNNNQEEEEQDQEDSKTKKQ